MQRPPCGSHHASPIRHDLNAEVRRAGRLSPKRRPRHNGKDLTLWGQHGDRTDGGISAHLVLVLAAVIVLKRKEMTGKAERRQIEDFKEAPGFGGDKHSRTRTHRSRGDQHSSTGPSTHTSLGQPLLSVLKYKIRG